MKTRFCLPIFILLLSLRMTFATDSISVVRPKIGLVLSGGGAKGFAHIGTLKMLDSLQIPVDYIAGTSMGAIAGALYAIGFTGLDLEKLAHREDWEEIFTDEPSRPQLPYFQKEQKGKYQLEFGMQGPKPTPPSGLIFGQKISLLFSSLAFPYEKINDFDNLPIPFRCVAVDLLTGNQVVLRTGSLAKAMRATMSIPTAFSPVAWGDSLLVDGGLINNLPVDIVRAMGADIVIAVDVQSPLLERKRLNSALAVLEQTVYLVGMERSQQNMSQADILIQPDVTGFSAADFDNKKIRQLCQEGDRAARKSVRQLVALQEKYNLRRLDNPVNLSFFTKPPIIYELQLTGNMTIPFQVIYDQLNLKPTKIFNLIDFQRRLSELKARGQYESIHYEVIPMSGETVRIIIRVKERQRPLINRVDIVDNKTLPFLFLYRLLGIKPGDRLDTELLNRRIMELYGLGYFELIQYEIEPMAENMVNLIIRIKELPIRRLRIGLRYDDLHKLVAAVSGQSTNFVIPGLRLEYELQFAGLTRFRFKAYYPSRALNLPIYPFLRCDFKDIPTHIFDDQGHKIAQYLDRSIGYAIGWGLVIAKSLNTEVEYHHEVMNIKPSIAFPDPTMFPTWKDKLKKIQATMSVDLLDDTLLPRNGILLRTKYEGSLRRLKSDLSYHQLNAAFDLYRTFQHRHTGRIYAFWGRSWHNLPIYKFLNQGRSQFFVGMNYDQLFLSNLSILRCDYRYEYRRDIFFKLILNGAFDLEYRIPQIVSKLRRLWGYGIGLTLLSPVGPIEIIVSRGDKDFLPSSNAKQYVIYFTMGYKF